MKIIILDYINGKVYVTDWQNYDHEIAEDRINKLIEDGTIDTTLDNCHWMISDKLNIQIL